MIEASFTGCRGEKGERRGERGVGKEERGVEVGRGKRGEGQVFGYKKQKYTMNNNKGE